MANTLAPFGFSHLGNTDGASPTFGLSNRLISKSDTTKIFFGDPVKLLSTGYIAQWTAGTAVSQLAGIFVGCEYLSTAQGVQVRNKFWGGADAAADPRGFFVPCNLSVPGVFLAQVSGSTPIVFADIGQNVDAALGSGSTVTGISAATVDFSTLGATATLPFRVIGLLDGGVSSGRNGSDSSSVNNMVLVAANVAGAGSTGI